MGKTGKIHRLMFTINNYTNVDIDRLKKEVCSYMVWGYEVGEECGTPHIQGYEEWNNAVSHRAWQKRNPRAHKILEVEGAPKDNAGYCKKGDTKKDDKPHGGWGVFYENPPETWVGEEWGSISEQGKRTDIEKYIDYIKAGNCKRKILDKYPNECAKFPRLIDQVQQVMCESEVQWLPRGTKSEMGLWIYGPPSAGKSEVMRDLWGMYYEKMCNKWWDGYMGEKIVLIDDPNIEWSGKLMQHLKIWVQEKPFQGEVKCSSRIIRFEKIIVLCNFSPKVYFGPGFEEEAFDSRFKTIEVKDRESILSTVRPQLGISEEYGPDFEGIPELGAHKVG